MAPDGRPRSLRFAGLLVALTLLAFGLRIASYRHGLPYVLHSDYLQVAQGATLLRTGQFENRSPYPTAHTLAYAGVSALVFVADRLGPSPRWAAWDDFVTELQGPTLSHAIDRAYTAVLGALLVPLVYLLARLRLERGAACLAAGLLAVSVPHVVYAHQARIHVPGITLLLLLVLPAWRLLSRPAPAGARAWLVAGLGLGASAGIIQLGWLALGAAGLLIALLVRPWRRTWRAGLATACGFLAGLVALTVLPLLLGVVKPKAHHGVFDNALTLGIPESALGMRFLEQFPLMLATYARAEPGLVVLLLVVGAMLWRRCGRDVLVFGMYPAVLFVVLGTNYHQARYSLSVTPFLAVLAAEGWSLLASARLRVLLAATALLLPLATSVRYDALLGREDTRALADRAVRTLADSGLSISARQSVLLDASAPPPGAGIFPPGGDYRVWTSGSESGATTLQRLAPDVFVDTLAAGSELGFVDADELEAGGFQRYGVVPGGTLDTNTFPDATDDLVLDAWSAGRPGPVIGFWARGPTARATLAARIPSDLVAPDRLAP